MNKRELQPLSESSNYLMTELHNDFNNRIQKNSIADTIVQLNRAQRRAMKKVK